MVRKAQLMLNDDDIEEVEFDATPRQGPKTKQERRLEDILSGLNDASDNAYIAVYKQRGTGKEAMSLVGKWPGDEFDSQEDLLLYLRDHYGGGSYRVHVCVEGRLVANTLVSVESPIEAPRKSGPDNAALMAVLDRMDKQDAKMNALYQQMLTGNSSPSRREMLEEMQLMAAMFGGGRTQSRGITDIAADIQALQGLGLNIGLPAPEKDDDEDGFSKVFEMAAPLFQHAAQVAPQPKQENPEMLKQKMLQLRIDQGLTMLINAAANGGDPRRYAELVCDQLNDAQLETYVLAPGAFAQMVARMPKARPYKVWFEDLQEHVKAMINRPSKFDDEYFDLPDDDENGITDSTPATDEPTDDATDL